MTQIYTTKHNTATFVDDIINERDEEIAQIKSEMVQVNALFHDMASLINDQGSEVDTILNNIQNSNDNVKQSSKSLDKALQETESTSWTLIGIGIAIGTVVVTAVTSIILL